MKKIVFACSLAFAAIAAHAALITVSYQDSSAALAVVGTFAGTDANQDGWLSYTELSSWSISLTPESTLADLNAIGDFDYVHNAWTPDGLQQDKSTADAYLTWNDWRYSMSMSANNWQPITSVEVEAADAPEPGSLALMGISLAALGLARRRSNRS